MPWIKYQAFCSQRNSIFIKEGTWQQLSWTGWFRNRACPVLGLPRFAVCKGSQWPHQKPRLERRTFVCISAGCVTSWLSFRWECGQHRGVLLMDTWTKPLQNAFWPFSSMYPFWVSLPRFLCNLLYSKARLGHVAKCFLISQPGFRKGKRYINEGKYVTTHCR